MSGRLTRTHRRLLRLLNGGAFLTGCYREPEDFMNSGLIFAGHSRGGHGTYGPVMHAGSEQFRVSVALADRMLNAGHIDHPEGASGIREFSITPAGRAALEAAGGGG